MDQTLLALIATLVAALIWVVKALQQRSDKMIEQRNREMSAIQKRSDALMAQRDAEARRSLGALESAVDAFKKFEAHEHETHRRLLDHMDASSQLQQALLVEMRSMHELLEVRFDDEDGGAES